MPPLALCLFIALIVSCSKSNSKNQTNDNLKTHFRTSANLKVKPTTKIPKAILEYTPPKNISDEFKTIKTELKSYQEKFNKKEWELNKKGMEYFHNLDFKPVRHVSYEKLISELHHTLYWLSGVLKYHPNHYLRSLNPRIPNRRFKKPRLDKKPVMVDLKFIGFRSHLPPYDEGMILKWETHGVKYLIIDSRMLYVVISKIEDSKFPVHYYEFEKIAPLYKFSISKDPKEAMALLLRESRFNHEGFDYTKKFFGDPSINEGTIWAKNNRGAHLDFKHPFRWNRVKGDLIICVNKWRYVKHFLTNPPQEILQRRYGGIDYNESRIYKIFDSSSRDQLTKFNHNLYKEEKRIKRLKSKKRNSPKRRPKNLNNDTNAAIMTNNPQNPPKLRIPININ